MAIDLANTLELQRDGTTADLLDDQDGPARWLRGSGGREEFSASQLQKLRGHVLALLAAAVRRRTLPPAAVAAVNRAGSAAPGVAQLEAGELVVRYNASPPDAFLADIATSAITWSAGPGGTRAGPAAERPAAADGSSRPGRGSAGAHLPAATEPESPGSRNVVAPQRARPDPRSAPPTIGTARRPVPSMIAIP
jgi:hypothetical protein